MDFFREISLSESCRLAVDYTETNIQKFRNRKGGSSLLMAPLFLCKTEILSVQELLTANSQLLEGLI